VPFKGVGRPACTRKMSAMCGPAESTSGRLKSQSIDFIGISQHDSNLRALPSEQEKPSGLFRGTTSGRRCKRSMVDCNTLDRGSTQAVFAFSGAGFNQLGCACGLRPARRRTCAARATADFLANRSQCSAGLRCRRASADGGCISAWVSSQSGSRTVKRDPSPSLLSTATVPPCRSTTILTR
jgi:hypothetical protein